MLIERHVGSIACVLAMTPLDDSRHGEATTAAVAKMLMVLPSKESGELGSEAKGEAYMDALEDVPFWAVQEAMRKWHRSEYGPKHEYKWQPGPSTLRDLSMIETYRVMAIRRRLTELVAAEPLMEFTESHRVNMRAKLEAHLKGLLGINKTSATGERIAPTESEEDAA